MSSGLTTVYSLDQVVELLDLEREELYLEIVKGVIPPPIVYNDSGCYWSRKEMECFLEFKEQGASGEELRMFCEELTGWRRSVIRNICN